jgi:hypothetical protein
MVVTAPTPATPSPVQLRRALKMSLWRGQRTQRPMKFTIYPVTLEMFVDIPIMYHFPTASHRKTRLISVMLIRYEKPKFSEFHEFFLP